MFWKYIEKIYFTKQIQNIPFWKNKQIDIDVLYKGYVWELGIELCKQDYLHPKMHCSWSIKKVLPALVPDMTY